MTEYDNSVEHNDTFDEESSSKLDKSLSITFNLEPDYDEEDEDETDDLFRTSFLPYNENNQNWSDDDIVFQHSDDDNSERYE